MTVGTKMMPIQVSWVTDGETPDLPKDLDLNEMVCNLLSDEYGWLIDEWKFSGEFAYIMQLVAHDWMDKEGSVAEILEALDGVRETIIRRESESKSSPDGDA